MAVQKNTRINKAANSQNKYFEKALNRIRELAPVTSPNKQIAKILNHEGLRTKRNTLFTSDHVRYLRFIYKISPIFLNRSELSTAQVAEKFKVNDQLVRFWVEKKFVNARLIGKKLWISIDKVQEAILKHYVARVRKKEASETLKRYSKQIHFHIGTGHE